jgi:allophanate hydrolase subunit 2
VAAPGECSGRQPGKCAGVEFLAGGLWVRAGGLPLRLALAGHFSAEVVGSGERRRVDSWRSLTLAPGESLRCGMPVVGRLGYLALAGMRLPQQFGSASTYVRAGLGGIDGRLLASGARLAGTPCHGGERVLRTPPTVDAAPIRVVLGPQDDYFDTPSRWSAFLSGTYHVSPAADRMGMRLDGPCSGIVRRRAAEITSDATVPGSIQVPGQGLPIVLLADGQTAGGYPKIATVISADLPRLAVMAPGQSAALCGGVGGRRTGGARARSGAACAHRRHRPPGRCAARSMRRRSTPSIWSAASSMPGRPTALRRSRVLPGGRNDGVPNQSQRRSRRGFRCLADGQR